MIILYFYHKIEQTHFIYVRNCTKSGSTNYFLYTLRCKNYGENDSYYKKMTDILFLFHMIYKLLRAENDIRANSYYTLTPIYISSKR